MSAAMKKLVSNAVAKALNDIVMGVDGPYTQEEQWAYEEMARLIGFALVYSEQFPMGWEKDLRAAFEAGKAKGEIEP